MRVLIVNTYERKGGAAIAARRLMDALNNHGIKAKMLVKEKQTDHIGVAGLGSHTLQKWHFAFERGTIWLHNAMQKKHLFEVDIANCGTDITSLPEFREADIIHLHWINQGMLSLNDLSKILQSGKPIVWTMHDMWPFTGICHYADQCTHYQTECHDCPLLLKPSKHDLSNKVFRKKMQIYPQGHIHFVGCSSWIADMARSSKLTTTHTVTQIPNAIPTHMFKPADKLQMRKKWRLPADKKLLLFGSVKVNDPRKGWKYLKEACNLLQQKAPSLTDEIAIVTFGSQPDAEIQRLPFRLIALSYIESEKELAEVYSACDAYITPSLQDNLPNTIVEAMACGLPCVAFNIGGIPEMIDHLKTGYLAEKQNAADLAQGIYQILYQVDYTQLVKNSLHKVQTTYTEHIVAQAYTQLYQKISGKHE